MTSDRFRNAYAITDHLPTPNGILTELLEHQKHGLAWMLWREKQVPPSGILADDMGLGKTLSFISLIVENLNRRKLFDEEEQKEKRKAIANFLVPSYCSLVIVPASLIYQWEEEIGRHVKPGLLRVYIFHGPKQKRETDPTRLAQYDVVLTTYSTVTNELNKKADVEVLDISSSGETSGLPRNTSKESVLTRVAWQRIILDEAHQIKNKNSLVSKACCRLPGICRWCSSGTPIHNKLWDLFSLIKFLRIRPFDEEAVWKEYIMGNSALASERLNTLVRGLLLRRQKTDINMITNKPIVSLKNFFKIYLCTPSCSFRQKVKEIIEQNISISKPREKWSKESVIRNPFLGSTRDISLCDNFRTMSCVLTLLLRLRQACVHMALTKKAVDIEAFRDIGLDYDEKDIDILDITSNLDQVNIDRKEEAVARLFEPSFNSTKVKIFFSVVVSQWTSLLEIIEQRLTQYGVEYTCITGKVLPKNRQQCVESFNRRNGGARVMLLSLTAGGVGLNLTGGNHLFLLDLHWNPAIEQQACDRIYRMGQKKDIFIYKFICHETIEQRVLNLQESKKALAESVLKGATSKKLNKLTINDIKFLFGLGSSGKM
ncbi:unnamed protein product [Enterobius vermicularis]|uniref:Helicase C-terminal domain-containing protein n=1 Tax=Enterobius vermicularis TaxID=51028 RepID=A0A0N4VGB3_ENTVE|nr:unnamed protein product [Enterobius vermicularis]